MGVINASSGIKAGTVAHFAASTAPTGWLKANGAAISRTAYAALFAAIGTTYGVGDGSTTFNVPDLRGEFVRSLDDGRGVDSGRAIGSYQNHGVIDHKHFQGAGEEFPILGAYSTTSWRNNSSTSGTPYLAWTSGMYSTSGVYAGQNETRPRNVALSACIKY
jgi:microcystin-dependent protein